MVLEACCSRSPARAQEQAVVEQLAQVLAAEDARDVRRGLFLRALLAPDSVSAGTLQWGPAGSAISGRLRSCFRSS